MLSGVCVDEVLQIRSTGVKVVYVLKYRRDMSHPEHTGVWMLPLLNTHMGHSETTNG